MGHESRKACILVIEDNPADVALLRLALENAELDCDLTVLEDGGEALAFIREPRKRDERLQTGAGHSGPQPS